MEGMASRSVVVPFRSVSTLDSQTERITGMTAELLAVAHNSLIMDEESQSHPNEFYWHKPLDFVNKLVFRSMFGSINQKVISLLTELNDKNSNQNIFKSGDRVVQWFTDRISRKPCLSIDGHEWPLP